MIVIDTSAAVAATVERTAHGSLLQRLLEDEDLIAPHLIDVEFVHAIRRLVHVKEISTDRADAALRDFADISITRYPHIGLRSRMWGLRANLSAYDAAFVSLAEALNVPLITVDGRIERAPGHSATVETY